MKLADRKREIYKLLENPEITTIVIHGKPGVGKTWTARKVSNIAKQKGLFDLILWVYLNREYDDITLLDSIAGQLSLLPTRGVSEVEDDDEEFNREVVLKIEALEKKIKEKKLLIVFDDEGNKMNEVKIRGMLDNLLKENYKVLVTTTKDPTNIGDKRGIFKLEPMVREESLSLLRERVFSDNKLEGIDVLAMEFIKRTKYMPNAIVIMAKAFKYFFDKGKGGEALLRRSLEEPSDSKIYNLTDLLQSGYDMVPYSILIDCQRDTNDKKKKFFTDSRCINHNELIAYWIMEGYLGHISCMDTAYRKGHEILMELLDFQILKRVEPDYITINPLGSEFDDFILRRASNYYRHGYYACANLGLDSVFDKVDWKGLLRISHKGGVMRTLSGGKIEKIVSTLLLDGNSMAKNLPNKFKKLQVLAIFNPTLDMLSPFSDDIISLLHVFVLRSCRFLKNLDQVHGIDNFKNLTILEISDSSSFHKFPEDFFARMPKLQSLNLSSLPIISLPKSLYKLEELKWLILRNCTKLTSLNSLRDCKNLVVLDCSGSTSLKDVIDRSFLNADLEVINLSDTKIKILPLFGSLKKLTHLLLSKCTSLNRLRSIKDMASLEVIDLSYASDFNEFFDKSLENLVNLKLLDLSGTSVGILPGHICNPRILSLENCTKLNGEGALECLSKAKDLEKFVLSNAGIQSLPSISHLTNLRKLSVTDCLYLKSVPDLNSLEKIEELDFSGCKNIKFILDNIFDKMSRLQTLNLSGTSIESLPSLENLGRLRFLFLKDCKELKMLPSVESNTSLKKLEELNISGCNSLVNIGDLFFKGTFNLHFLNLSDTQLEKLPSFSKLENLRELYLRNCKGLKSLPDLEKLKNLEILDLSGTAVSELPSLSNLIKLRELMLNNCSSLSLFQDLRTLNIVKAHVQELPYGISKLTSLERLDLPRMGNFQEIISDGCEWGISNLSGTKENKPSVSVNGTQFLEPLEKDILLWESIFNKFHLRVYPINELGVKNVPHFHGGDFVYRDIYLQNKYISESDDQRLLEIFGFSSYKPAGNIDTVISHANQLFFHDNKFQVRIPASEEIIQTLPSFLTACNSKKIKGCWIEKCSEIEVIFGEKDIVTILGLLNSLETLSVSNITSLKSLFEIPKEEKENRKDEVFQKLEKLFIEYCPNLSTVLSLSQLPKKLKILQIKFCDKLGKVFDLNSQEIKLQYLETLHLWELPALESIGCNLPSLKRLKISNCPNLQKLEETIKSAESLQNLSISNVCNLKTMRICKELKYLSIESCPNLLEIVASFQRLSDLEIRIRFCNKLETLFDEGNLSEIKLLHLHGLPKLKTIGAKLPNQEMCFIIDCLNLKIDL